MIVLLLLTLSVEQIVSAKLKTDQRNALFILYDAIGCDETMCPRFDENVDCVAGSGAGNPLSCKDGDVVGM